MKRIVKTRFPDDPWVMDPSVVGIAVRAARTQHHLSIEEAALSIGVAKQTLSDIEAGKPSVSFGLVLKVANELGVSLLVVPSANRERIQRLLQCDSP